MPCRRKCAPPPPPTPPPHAAHCWRPRGLAERLRERDSAGWGEREGLSVVHAGQSKRPQFLGGYLVGFGV